MTSSVDRLFENDGDVFISSNYNDFNQPLPAIQEVTSSSAQSKSPEPNSNQLSKLLDQSVSSGGRESPSTATSTAKSSRRDSLTDKIIVPTQTQLQQQAVGRMNQQQIPPPPTKPVAFEVPKSVTSGTRNSTSAPINNSGGGELFEKFQNRQKLNREDT